MANETVYAVIAKAYQDQPNLKLATNPKENCIGSWDESKGRFVMVAALDLRGVWVSMPYELLVNGKHIVEDWQPVAA